MASGHRLHGDAVRVVVALDAALAAGRISYYDVHLVAYAGLGVGDVRARRREAAAERDVARRLRCRRHLIALRCDRRISSAFVPGRTFDVLDMLADAIGSVVGASAVGAWGIIRRRSETRDVL